MPLNGDNWTDFKTMLQLAEKEQLKCMAQWLETERSRRRNWFERHWLLMAMTVAWVMFSPWTLPAMVSDQWEAAIRAVLEGEPVILVMWYFAAYAVPCRWIYLGIHFLVRWSIQTYRWHRSPDYYYGARLHRSYSRGGFFSRHKSRVCRRVPLTPGQECSGTHQETDRA